MKLCGLFVMVLAVLALFISGGQTAPKVNVNALKKGAKAIGTGLKFVGAAGTAHELWQQHRQG
nr:moricin 1 [Dioryctria sylvestrella]